MYLDFYQLQLKPFQISTDPKFLWLGEKHKEALAVLKYGILDNKGFLLLTGDVGTGKTTLLNALIGSLGENVLVAMVTDPGLAKMDFFNFVADSFEMDKSFKSKGEFLIYLKNFLLGLHRQNKQALLIIDEAQHLNQKLLEEVRLLSNIEKYNTKLINIFFVGQSEFNEIILRPRNRAIRQRITINYNITPLSESETGDYIRFRLEIAGTDKPIFTPRAIKAVFAFSNGYPRLINIVCDQALLTGYVKEKTKIDKKIVTECADELKISHGFPIHKSRATPEAVVEQQPIEPLVNENSGAAPVAGHRDANRPLGHPLMIVLIALMVLWIGLISVYFFTRESGPPSALKVGMDEPSVTATADRSTQSQTSQGQASHATPTGENSGTVSVTPTGQAPGSPEIESAGPKQANTEADKAIAVNDAPQSKETERKEAPITLEMINETYGVPPEVYFGFNSNSLDDQSYAILHMVAKYCVQNPGAKLILKGYSDSSGVRSYNIKLSEFRANMVKTYLVGRGVSPLAVKTLAMGPEAQGANTAQRKVVIEIVTPE